MTQDVFGNGDLEMTDPSLIFRKSVMDSLEKQRRQKRSSERAMGARNPDEIDDAAPSSHELEDVDGDNSPLIRLQSSSGSSSMRNKNHLFEDDDDNENNQNISKASSSVKTPSWLRDEDATLLASQIGDEQSKLFSDSALSAAAAEDGKQRRQARNDLRSQSTESGQRSSSLFGAVMQKIGSTIGITSHQYESPRKKQRLRPTSSIGAPAAALDININESSNGAFSAGAAAVGGVVNGLFSGSPSGKTIMDIVNRFNSPFRFQSPNKKPRRRRLLSSPSTSNHEKKDFTTPSPS